MKSTLSFALALAFLAGCAQETAEPAAPPIPAGAAEVVTEPAEDAMTDTLMLDDDVIIDESDLEAGEVEDLEAGQ